MQTLKKAQENLKVYVNPSQIVNKTLKRKEVAPQAAQVHT